MAGSEPLVSPCPPLAPRERPPREASGCTATCGEDRHAAMRDGASRPAGKPPAEEDAFPGFALLPSVRSGPRERKSSAPLWEPAPSIPASPPSPRNQSQLPSPMRWGSPHSESAPDPPPGTGTVPTAGAAEHGAGCGPSWEGRVERKGPSWCHDGDGRKVLWQRQPRGCWAAPGTWVKDDLSLLHPFPGR